MIRCLRPKKNKNGFTILELMAAIFVATVGLLGVTTIIQNLSINTSFFSDKLIASYLAQEGIEIVRNIRDTNWLEKNENPENSWNEGLINNCLNGCEIDYFCTTVEDPDPNNPSGHNCFRSYNDSHYLRIDSDGFYSYSPSGTDTKFRRKIIVTQEDQDILKVEVFVYWRDKGRDYSFSALEKLYNWR